MSMDEYVCVCVSECLCAWVGVSECAFERVDFCVTLCVDVGA